MLCMITSSYVVFGELIGLEVRRLPDAAKNYLSPTVRLLIHSPAFPLLHSHVLSSRLRLRQGPPSRRLSRPRPCLLRRRRLHILSLLYCHNSSKVQLHRRQVAAVYQCHLVVCVVHFAGICATHHCRVPGRKVDIGPLSRPVISVPGLLVVLTAASYRPQSYGVEEQIRPSRPPKDVIARVRGERSCGARTGAWCWPRHHHRRR